MVYYKDLWEWTSIDHVVSPCLVFVFLHFFPADITHTFPPVSIYGLFGIFMTLFNSD